MSTSEHQQFDICILCALSEEAERLKEAFQEASAKIFKDQYPVEFKPGYSSNLRRNYDYATITNNNQEQLSVLVIWLADNGPMETGLQLQPLLEEFKPRFAAMTGICAGDRKEVRLGDIIVAERAFLYDVGKIVERDGKIELQHDTPVWSLPTEVLQAVRGFTAWKQVVAKEPRPPSLRQQCEWLLNRLLTVDTLRVDEIPQPELAEHVPNLRKVLAELQKTDSHAFLCDLPQNTSRIYLNEERKLQDPMMVRDLHYKVDFPFKDAPKPEVYIKPMASGSTVRADNPFAAIRVPVRGTLAIEMEGAAFYRTLKDFGNTQYLVVKGVCDYADKDKDDSYHKYAGKISALYLFAFLRAHVTSERFYGIGRQGKEAPYSSSVVQAPDQSKYMISPATSEQSSIQPSGGKLNLFYSYAPEDEEFRKRLEKSLVLLTAKRGGPLRDDYYANNIRAGFSNDAAALLEHAQIIILLVSDDFIANDDLYNKQLSTAIALQKAGKAHVIPVLLHSTHIEGTPLEGLVMIPRHNKPIDKWSNKDEAFYEVTKEIRAVVESFKQ
jgi:nucleoside phosphorylase